MTTSLSNHAPSLHPVHALEENPHDEGNPYETQLRGLSHQQLADRMKWLSWYQPGVFTAVMDYVGFCENLAADSDPTNPLPAPDDVNYGETPAPVCARCGSDIGIFIKFGLDWRHYRADATLDKAEIFDPGHAPELAWRVPDSTLAEI